MTSFLHVLLLLALCVFGNQALNNQTGCPNGNGNAQYNINEKLPIGNEVILFKNIKNITLPGTEFDVTKKGDEEYAVILKKLYVYDASNIGNNIKYVHFTCVPNHGPTIQGMLTVVLNNVIETPPDFGQSGNAHFNIPENSPSGTQVGKVNVEVTDGDTNTIVLFNLTKIGTPFTIDWPPNNTPRRYFKGVISVQYPELLDYETTPEYNLTVKATIAGTNLTSTTTVYINVIDVDDMFPRFDPSNEYNKTIPEKKYNRYEIATLLAEDEDTGPSKTQDINYSLIRAFPETSLFEVVNTTGQVLVTGTLDRETCDNYLLLLKAYQVDKPDLRMDVATLNVTVSDVDDNPPVMTQTSYEVRIPENTPKDVVVFAFTATDADKGKNAEFQYMIENQGSIDAFKIDSASGVLRVNNGSFLDRETHSNLTFSVLAESTQNRSIRSHEANVTIILLDENDNSPKFSSPFYTFTVNKNISSPWYIGAVYANDSDESNNGNVVYQLRGNESRRFTISKAGSINAIASLASDYQPWYRFTVTASDNAKFKRQTSVQVELQVIDVNVNKPYFMNMTKSISVQEDIDEGSELLIIQAYDEDPSDDLTFMLHNVSDFILKGVDTRKSKILINKALDRETRPDGYNLTVTVTDSLHTATATLSVTIEDVNDNAPVFQYPDHNFAVFEGVHNKVIGNVTATDQDIKKNGLLHYSIGPTWYGNFSITQTGEIMVISDLDRESLNATSGKIVLLVFVEDKGKPPLMATATATVQVKDINDHAPRFKNLEENITINEGQNISKHIQAYDEDEGKNGDIHYIIGHSNNSVLKVENDVLISTSPLTYGVYEVEVISYNTVPYTRTALKNDTLTVYIHVKDVNNHEPQFNRTSYRFTLPEDFTVGHLVNRSVCEIYAEDKDETLEYNTVTYSMVDKDGYFEIDPRDASLRLIKPLDFEETKQVNFKVMATDGDPTHQQTVNVTVKIMNVNDNAPRFSSDIYNCSVEENSSQALDCTVPIRATDNDTAEDRLTFSIDGYMKDIFTINSTTGEIRPTSPLDADAGPSIYVTEIKVVDDGIPQYTGSAVVEVTVADKNDNSPVIHGPSHIAIPENLPINTTVATIFATDLDINDNLTFSLSTTDNYGQFSVRSDKSIGYVILNHHLDREANASYILEFYVIDTANHTNSASLNITVLDVNDNQPQFQKDIYNVTVKEGPYSDSLTIETEADDSDEGPNAKLKYSIISQDFGHHFSINSTTGTIGVLTSLNREDTSIYTLVIQAADDGETNLSGTATVLVNVEDINDCAPEFLQTTYSAAVMEGSPSGTSVIHLTAVDNDVLPINKNVSYSILDDSDLFGVDEDGMLTLKQKVVLGTHPTPYIIQVEATDGEFISMVNVTISVIDVNDHDPVFNKTFYLFSVPENDEFAYPPSVFVGMVSASDADPGRNGEVSYSILSTDVPVFTISQENGFIATNGTLDRDRCVNSRYTFTVIATDNGNATRTGFVEVTVTITDVNDNRPNFTSSHYDGNIVENSVVGTEVNIHPAIIANDIDAGDNGTNGIVFYLSTDSPFIINNTTGRIFVNNAILDREKQDTYDLMVLAVDQSGSGNNNSASLTIKLTDANDESPVFTHNISVFNINESVPSSYTVGTVHTLDADIDGNVTTRYDIDSGGDGRFYIDPIQGDIIVTGGLDREQKGNYTLIIRASDGLNYATAEVDIILEDANDNAPIFPSNPVVINVTESNANVSGIHNFTAYDPDLGENARLSFFINKSDTSIFTVSEDGILSTTKPIDRETNASYSFLVHVHDNGTPSLSSSVMVICHVLDSNDNYPIFYDSNGNETIHFRTFILEKSPIDSPVFFPYVRDKDLGLNSLVHFQLLGAEKDLFNCNANTGVVTIAKRIEINSLLEGKGDNETASYVDVTLVVEASDEGHPSRSTNMTLHVTVEQISDENPVFVHNLYEFNVSESTSNGSYIGVVKALMPNVTNFYLTYSFVMTTNLLILEKESGKIKLNSALDREESERYTFAVQVTDGKTPERTAFTMVNINVTDVNDNPPHFDQLSYVFTVTEGIYTMFEIGKISATDRDTGRNAMIQYSLNNYTGDIFSVDKTTGGLVINGTLDREANAEFTLIVQADDDGLQPLNDTAVVRVVIQDVNDNSPQFQLTNYTCFVYENAPYKQICNISATDDDMGDNGTVVYSIQENNIPFYINPIDGTIWKSGLTDFETKNTYNLTLEARDLGSPERSSSVSLVITIGDVPDTAPHFPHRMYNVYTSPFIPPDTVLLNETAGNGDVTYTISDGPRDVLDTFYIDPMNGVISVQKLMDAKKSTYILTVQAEEANLTDTTVVVIHLRNEPASFNQSNFTVSVKENHHVGLLLDLNTTEELAGIPVHYTLISVKPEEIKFVVNNTTGQIYCSGNLDREQAQIYILEVSAEIVRNSRKSGRSKRSFGDSLGQVTVTVWVGDENDNPPTFSLGMKHVYRVPASLKLASKVAELQAFDPDENSIITYQLENSGDLPFFLESDNKTRILLKSPLEVGSYHLTVSAIDEGGHSSDVNITIITIPDTDRLTYVIPMSPQDFEKQEKALIANLSSVLGVNITMEGYKTHISKEVEPSKTDLLLFATNRTTGRLLSRDELSSLISAKFADIFKLFKCNSDTCYIQTVPVKHSVNVMTAPEIALLTIAVLIFVGCVLVIIAGNHVWKQFDTAREQEVKMWELESFRSDSRSHAAAGTINPNKETSFASLDNGGDLSSGLAANKKRTVLYESQELTMNFDNDAFVLEPPVANGADSGVENDSSSSSSNMDDNESPRPAVYRDTSTLGKVKGRKHLKQGASGSSSISTLSLPSQQQPILDKTILQIEMETGTTSEDDLDIDHKDTASISSTDIKSTNISTQSMANSETPELLVTVVTKENDQAVATSNSDTINLHTDTVPSGTSDGDPTDKDIEEEMVTSF